MNEATKKFNEAMNADPKQQQLDSAFEGFMKSAMDLAREIASKKLDASPAEKKFMLETTKLMIIGLIHK